MMKRIFSPTIYLALLFSATMCQAITVQPIIPGEGIWNVTTRIGIVLDQLLCGGSAICDVLIHQSDIGNGGTFTITGSNTYYCLAQSVTFNTGSAITINANNVTLDLNGHVIDGGRNTTNGITLGNGVRNVIIKNGTIQNIGGTTAGSNGAAITDAAAITTPLKNIAIKDMNFNNNSLFILRMQNGIFSGAGLDELLIENCRANDSGAIAVSGGATIVVQGCEINYLNRNSGPFIAIDLVTIPSFFTPFGRYCLVEDCIVTSSFTQNSLILIANYRNAIVRNCITEGNFGVAVTGCKNATISDCIAQSSIVKFGGSGNETVGFVVNPTRGQWAVIERCVASQYGIGFWISASGSIDSFGSVRLTDCVAENNREAGFLYAPPTPLTTSNTSFKRCCATANGVGFGIVLGATNPALQDNFLHVLLEDCVAQDNLGDGFAVVNEKANGTIRDVVFRNCVAQRNQGGGPYFTRGPIAVSAQPTTFRGDGFSLGTATFAGTAGPIRDVIFIDCVSQNNAHDGFAFASTTTKVKILNCLAMKNTGTGINNMAGNATYILGNSSMLNNLGDYFGQNDPNKIAANGNPGALLGAGRWVNAKT
jgi:hypothetical protein